MAATARGRSCPISYRLRPEDLAGPATCSATTLYVIGGLYGSVAALDAVLERVAQDGPAVVVFNGDFHYLDVAEEDFLRIADGVSGHLATRGNVETELATAGDGGGCGCGYPDYVDDGTVERSNAVMSRLRETAQRHPALVAPMAELPRQLVVEVGGLRVAVLHGDPEQSAGWRLALEAMEPGDDEVRSWTGFEGATTSAGQIVDWLRRGGVQVLACTHTGLPYAQDVEPSDWSDGSSDPVRQPVRLTSSGSSSRCPAAARSSRLPVSRVAVATTYISNPTQPHK